jgi:Cdc6-like AAA superfamily ATPase
MISTRLPVCVTVNIFKLLLILTEAYEITENRDIIQIERHFQQFPHGVTQFVYRNALLRKIEESFKEATGYDPPTVVLCGMGGQGKTQLALAFCRQIRRSKSIFWANASSEVAMTESLEGLWNLIKTPDQIADDVDSKISYVYRNLSDTTQPWMLVFDNYDDPESFRNVRQFIPQGSSGAVLFTSRHSNLSDLGIVVEIPGFEEDEALRLLERQTATFSERCMNGQEVEIKLERQKIVRRLGYLPLAIDQAAAYIRDMKYDLKEFLPRYERSEHDQRDFLQRTPDFWEYPLPERSKRATALSVFTTWELSFQLLHSETHERDAKACLLAMFAFLDFRDISDEIFIVARNSDNFNASASPLKTPTWPRYFYGTDETWNREKLDRTLQELAKRSLIQNFRRSETDRFLHFSLHPLVSDWVKLRLSLDVRRECFQQAVKLAEGCCTAFISNQLMLSLQAELQLSQHLSALESNLASSPKNFREDKGTSRLSDLLKSISRALAERRYERAQQERRNIADWISSLNNTCIPTIADKYPSHTHRWFFDHRNFQAWLNSKPALLWCQGSLGSGKSTLASQLSFRLETTETAGQSCVATCQVTSSMSAYTLYGSLVKNLYTLQVLSEGFEDCEMEIQRLYSKRSEEVRFATLQDMTEILQTVSVKRRQIFLVIDGLDRLEATEQNSFLKIVDNSPTFLKFMIMSRPNVCNLPQQRIEIPIEATSESIYLHVQNHFLSDRDIKDIVKQANGSYVLGFL